MLQTFYKLDLHILNGTTITDSDRVLAIGQAPGTISDLLHYLMKKFIFVNISIPHWQLFLEESLPQCVAFKDLCFSLFENLLHPKISPRDKHKQKGLCTAVWDDSSLEQILAFCIQLLRPVLSTHPSSVNRNHSSFN